MLTVLLLPAAAAAAADAATNNHTRCGVKYVVALDSSSVAHVLETTLRAARDVTFYRVEEQQADGALGVDVALTAVSVASAPAAAAGADAPSVSLLAHGLLMSPATGLPMVVYSEVDNSTAAAAAGTQHTLRVAICDDGACSAKRVASYAVSVAGADSRVRVQAVALPQAGAVMLAVQSGRTLQTVRCDAASARCEAAGYGVVAAHDVTHMSMQVDAASQPVVVYATAFAADAEEAGAAGAADAASADAATATVPLPDSYSIGLVRDVVHVPLVTRVGALRSLSFVLDPETDAPVLLASAEFADEQPSRVNVLRSCTDLYCQRDDDAAHIVTLPSALRGLSAVARPGSVWGRASNGHGQVLFAASLRSSEESEHVLLRADILRDADWSGLQGMQQEADEMSW